MFLGGRGGWGKREERGVLGGEEGEEERQGRVRKRENTWGGRVVEETRGRMGEKEGRVGDCWGCWGC